MAPPASGAANIIVVAQMPPPVTGLAVMNSAMVQAFASAGLGCEIGNVAPRPDTSGWRKVLGRALRVGVAGAKLVRQRISGWNTFYMPSDSAAGIVFNIGLLILARGLGYQVWIHHHNFSYLTRRSTPMAALLRLAPRGTHHIVLCGGMLDRLKAVYPREWDGRGHQGQVVSNAFILDFDDAPAQRSGKVTLGHLSNLTAEKGAVRFVDLFMKLRSNGLDIAARMAGPVGDGETAAAIERAKAAYPADFEWMGPVYGEAKAAFYRSIHAFVFPTRYVNEAQPLVLLEALASGAAILATDRGCIGCNHRESPGLVVADEDFDQAAERWLRDLCETRAFDRLAQEALEAARRAKAEAVEQLASLLAALKGSSAPPHAAAR